MSPKVAYNIYPTMLDSYAWMMESEASNAVADFLERVNRAPMEPKASLVMGKIFEEAVDVFANTNDGEDLEKLLSPTALVPIRAIAERIRGAVRQVEVEAEIETVHGLVRLYGKVDEILMDCAYDVKTCRKYEFPKYLHNFQHLAYLEGLRAMQIKRFVYLVTDFEDLYEEEYSWTQDGRDRLVEGVTELVDFLERHRELITDRKVFGLEPIAAAG